VISSWKFFGLCPHTCGEKGVLGNLRSSKNGGLGFAAEQHLWWLVHQLEKA